MPQHESTIKLGFGNNLIMGHVPDEKLSLEQITNKRISEKDLDLGIFGLFDSNQANYNTFYPEVTAEDLTPSDQEFIKPLFRALSEVVVHKDWNPVDFSIGNVLRKSTNLLLGQTVNADHETAIGNALGAVSKVAWEEAYTTDNGIKIPAGINSELKLDGKSHPRIARAIMMDPPAIHSTSVTVQFLWEKSHDIAQDEFFRKLGTLENGQLVRRIATKVKRYHEISLVSHGADPYAQKINKEGEINNPKFADISYNAENGAKKSEKIFFFDFKTDCISNSEDSSIPLNSNNINNDHMKETLIQLCALLGITLAAGQDPTVDMVQNKIKELTADKTADATTIQNLTTERDNLKTENEGLKANKPDAAKLAALESFQTQALTDLRTQVTKAYNLSCGNKPEATITEMINNADYKVLQGLHTQYTSLAEEKFPLSCKSCGSTEISRASAKSTEGGEGTETKEFKALSGDETVDYFQKLSEGNTAAGLHGAEEDTKK